MQMSQSSSYAMAQESSEKNAYLTTTICCDDLFFMLIPQLKKSSNDFKIESLMAKAYIHQSN